MFFTRMIYVRMQYKERKKKKVEKMKNMRGVCEMLCHTRSLSLALTEHYILSDINLSSGTDTGSVMTSKNSHYTGHYRV